MKLSKRTGHQEQNNLLQMLKRRGNQEQDTPKEVSKRTRNNDWFMVGIDKVKHSNGQGHFDIYLNGQLIKSIELAPDRSLDLDPIDLTLGNGQFSCIEVNNKAMDESYFKDFELKECSKYGF